MPALQLDPRTKTLFTEISQKISANHRYETASLSLTIELYKLREAGKQLRDYSFFEKEGTVRPRLFFFPPLEGSLKVEYTSISQSIPLHLGELEFLISWRAKAWNQQWQQPLQQRQSAARGKYTKLNELYNIDYYIALRRSRMSSVQRSFESNRPRRNRKSCAISPCSRQTDKRHHSMYNVKPKPPQNHHWIR